MLAQILPAHVVAVERLGDRPLAAATASVAAPAERAALGRAVAGRRLEFATARACAREALARIGAPADAVGAGAAGEPLWPAGIAGSITHCAGYRACAVARSARVAALGIDAEPHAPLTHDVLYAVASADERRSLQGAADEHPEVHWDRVLFSAKECAYKAWYPLARSRIGPEEIALSLDTGGWFTAALPAGGPREIAGRWLVGDGLVVTAALVPAGSAGAVADRGRAAPAVL